MSESIQHNQLVDKLLMWTYKNHSQWKGTPVVVTADHASQFEGKRPPRIGEAVPDVYATSLPLSFCLIGEAKTTTDLETLHSQHQIECFLSYLRLQNDPWLVMAVPWNLMNTARNLLRVLARKTEAQRVTVIFLSDIDGIDPRKCLK